MVAFIQKAHGCIFLYDAIEVQEAQLAISDRVYYRTWTPLHNDHSRTSDRVRGASGHGQRILCDTKPRRNMSRPLRTRTSQKGMRIGMHVIPVVSTSQMDIPVKHALHIRGSRTTTSTSPGRMRSRTSIRDTNAQLKTATRRFSRRCDS
jgi:hypothetical protein